MEKYTHRVKITKEEIKEAINEGYDDPLGFIDDYYKDGYLYGFYADGWLVGDVIDWDPEYLVFEWWWRVDTSRVELVGGDS